MRAERSDGKEWDVAMPGGEEIQCLTDRLKKHFSISGGSASKASERDQMREQMKKSVPEGEKKVGTPVRKVQTVITGTACGLLLFRGRHRRPRRAPASAVPRHSIP
jgi:hypothetical protein